MNRTGLERLGRWDPESYDQLSDPQVAWGRQVLDRIELHGDEIVLDAGCGTGRLTSLLLERLPAGRVIAVDRSGAMLAEARSKLAGYRDRVTYLCADLQSIALRRPVDAVFSTSTFHWVLDHPRLFRTMVKLLTPGGTLEAQCGGGPNLAHLRARVYVLIDAVPYVEHFAGHCCVG